MNDTEVKAILDMYIEGYKIKDIAERFNRSEGTISTLAGKAGIQRYRKFTEEELEYIKEHYKDVNIDIKDIATHFNTTVDTIKGVAKKLGIKKQQGRMYIDNSGYYCKDKHTQIHRKIYEQHYGPIPEGYVVHHIDHNKLNNDPENLFAMPRSVHQKYHCWYRRTHKNQDIV